MRRTCLAAFRVEVARAGATQEAAALVDDGDHYRARVVSAAFAGKNRVQQHKLVYEALGARMGGELHALQLVTAVPN